MNKIERITEGMDWWNGKTSHITDPINTFFSKNDGVLSLAGKTGYIGQHVATMNGNAAAAETYGNLRGAAGTMRSTQGAIRFFFKLDDWLAGRTLFKRDESGKITGWQDRLYIIHQVVLTAARSLSFTSWLNTMKAIDLGEHAKRMGTAVQTAWTVVMSLGLIKTFRNVWKDYTEKGFMTWKNKKSLISGVLWTAAMPGEMGFTTGGNPILGIVTTVMAMIAQMWSFVSPLL